MRTRQIDVVGTYNTFGEHKLGGVVITDLIPSNEKQDGQRMVLEITVTARKWTKGDKEDGVYVLADNPSSG